MVTFAAFCTAYDQRMETCGDVELDRVWGKIEEIQAKQAVKKARHVGRWIDPSYKKLFDLLCATCWGYSGLDGGELQDVPRSRPLGRVRGVEPRASA